MPMTGPLTVVSFRFAELSKNPPEGISVGLIEENIFEWEVMIIGSIGTMVYVDVLFCYLVQPFSSDMLLCEPLS